MAQFKEDNDKPDGQAPGLATTKILLISWKLLRIHTTPPSLIKKIMQFQPWFCCQKTSNNFGIYNNISIKERTDLSKLIIIADFKIAHHNM